jgi:hypothetical protein
LKKLVAFLRQAALNGLSLGKILGSYSISLGLSYSWKASAHYFLVNKNEDVSEYLIYLVGFSVILSDYWSQRDVEVL